MCVGGEGVGDNKEQYTYHSCSSVVVVVFVIVVFVVVVVAAVAAALFVCLFYQISPNGCDVPAVTMMMREMRK